MITAANPTNRSRVLSGDGYDGVVRVSVGGFYGTGVLLYDGRAVLTAAHLFENKAAINAQVTFETSAGTQKLPATKVLLHPNYESDDISHDLALVWLQSNAPRTAERTELYRLNDELDAVVTMVGYGLKGTGSTGAVDNQTSPEKIRARNVFEATGDELKTVMGSIMSWSPPVDAQLIADFDNGRLANDALGLFLHRHDLGLGLDEGMIAPGDSGSPAFIGTQVAGIASYTASLSKSAMHDPDIDAEPNSSFGEIAAWSRVSHYQQWIDQSIRSTYPSAPDSPSEVRKSVPEGDSSLSLAYFLVQFLGERTDPDQWISVDFSTRDGTATAGEDYLHTAGTLILYPGETHTAIPVEVIGDTKKEADEYFFLDVFNPVGGSFGQNVTTLTAVRTIIDDDWA